MTDEKFSGIDFKRCRNESSEHSRRRSFMYKLVHFIFDVIQGNLQNVIHLQKCLWYANQFL